MAPSPGTDPGLAVADVGVAAHPGRGVRQSAPYFLRISASIFVHCLPTAAHFSCV